MVKIAFQGYFHIFSVNIQVFTSLKEQMLTIWNQTASFQHKAQSISAHEHYNTGWQLHLHRYQVWKPWKILSLILCI